MSAAGVVSFEEARRIVADHAAQMRVITLESVKRESVALVASRGRVLAEPLVADRDFPPFPRATRDGFAVRAADVGQVPARLEVTGEIKAGDSPDGKGVMIQPGQAVSIMTGAPLPHGADAVAMVEYTAEQSAAGSRRIVEIQSSVKGGENFVPRGAEARSGQTLVEAGRRLDHALIAVASAIGKSRVSVFQRPSVAVLSTGDEVVEIETAPGPAQIRNSNSYSLAAQIEAAGGEAVRLPIAPDEPKRLRALMEQGLACDLLLLTGGVSMGKYDLVEEVLGELGAEFYFTSARIQPGKPVVCGSCAGSVVGASKSDQGSIETRICARKYFFGLPGNPVSTMVTFRLFVEPMIAALAGAHPMSLIFPKARLKREVRTKTGLTRFLPAVLSGEFDAAEVELAAWQGSGDIAALARANCYLVVPPDRERIDAGEWVSLLMP
jgi:molybdopterin molybdotransferase